MSAPHWARGECLDTLRMVLVVQGSFGCAAFASRSSHFVKMTIYGYAVPVVWIGARLRSRFWARGRGRPRHAVGTLVTFLFEK